MQRVIVQRPAMRSGADGIDHPVGYVRINGGSRLREVYEDGLPEREHYLLKRLRRIAASGGRQMPPRAELGRNLVPGRSDISPVLVYRALRGLHDSGHIVLDGGCGRGSRLGVTLLPEGIRLLPEGWGGAGGRFRGIERRIIDLMRAVGGVLEADCATLASELRCPRQSCYRALLALQQDGRIVRRYRGRVMVGIELAGEAPQALVA